LLAMGRDDRVASNEGLLREINDRIEEIVSGEFGRGEAEAEAQEGDFLCECGQENCIESVHMKVSEYEKIRREKTRFVVVPGHEDDEIEEVVDRHERYVVVEKHPEEAAIAEATDPERH
jgi:hypothetical protein